MPRPLSVSTLFQFHKGTIKTDVVDKMTNGITVFQFHKGTIKTVFDNKAKEGKE